MASNDIQSPTALGFSMPAEWEKHEATWLTWPTNTETWPDARLQIVQDIYYQIITALLPNEKVYLLVDNEETAERIRKTLSKKSIPTGDLQFHIIPTVDTWIRDYGPTFVKDDEGTKAWCKWDFNAWGNKYKDLATDTNVFKNNAAIIPSLQFDINLTLEGGSIETNGAGSLLVTKQCLLNKNRNPKLTQTTIEAYLKDFLGVTQVLWMNEGISGDDTDGHIDDIIRFVSKDTLLVSTEEDADDPNYKPLQENWELLKNSKTPEGKNWNLIPLPMPGPILGDGERLPASYANFYIANNVVLLPIYHHENDKKAIKILEEAFVDRKVISIYCNDLVYGLGSIHCITQQEPS
jgi:agmatine deiminase